MEVQRDLTEFISRFDAAIAGSVDEMDRRRRVGACALAASTVSESKRRAVIAARLPTADWPERDLRILAVNAATGEVVIFTRDSGVMLVEAVAASCAVPGIWPPARIGEHRYVDGSVRSSPNRRRVWGDLRTELDALSNSDVEVVYADQESMRAVGNPLAVDTRAQAARAGRIVGRILIWIEGDESWASEPGECCSNRPTCESLSLIPE